MAAQATFPRELVRTALAVCLQMERAGRSTYVPRLVGDWMLRRGLASAEREVTWRDLGVLFDPVKRGTHPVCEYVVRLTDTGRAAAERAEQRAMGC